MTDTGGMSAKEWIDAQDESARRLRPKRVRLGAYTLPVRFRRGYLVSDGNDIILEHPDDGDLGMAKLVDEWAVFISDRSPDPANTLLHELLHLVMRNTGSDRLMGCRDDEETLVSGMAHGVTELLRRNPGLGEYLTRGK